MINAEPVLVICSEAENQDAILASLRNCSFDALPCCGYSEARKLLEKWDFSVVLCSDSLTDGDFREVIKTARPVPVVVLSRLAEWGPYLAALRAGAFDYIACPPDPAEVKRILRSAVNEGCRRRAALAVA